MVANELFIESDEVLVSELKVANINVAAGTLGKQYCVLSNKRLYHKGGTYVNGTQGGVQNGENTVDLREVTCSGYYIIRHYLLLVFGILFLLGCAVGGIVAKVPALIAVGAVLFIIFLIAFRVKQIRVVKVYFGGGCVAFQAWSASEEALHNFNREIQRAAGLSKNGKVNVG